MKITFATAAMGFLIAVLSGPAQASAPSGEIETGVYRVSSCEVTECTGGPQSACRRWLPNAHELLNIRVAPEGIEFGFYKRLSGPDYDARTVTPFGRSQFHDEDQLYYEYYDVTKTTILWKSTSRWASGTQTMVSSLRVSGRNAVVREGSLDFPNRPGLKVAYRCVYTK